MRFDKLAEHQIRKAEHEGQLDDLKGAGKPLDLSSDKSADGVGIRMMAEKGVLPKEFELKKHAEKLRAEISHLPDGEARTAKLKELADIEMRRAIEEEARRKYMKYS